MDPDDTEESPNLARLPVISRRRWSASIWTTRPWPHRLRLAPVPGFQWDRSSRGEMLRQGIFKLNDYCVLVVVIPFCRFGGKIQYNGGLSKDMRDPKSPDQ
jgi:hypothetical protein